MKELRVAYGHEPVSTHLTIGHNSSYSKHPNYLFVHPCHKPEKNFLAASQKLCQYLLENTEIQLVHAVNNFQILYYAFFHKSSLKINRLTFEDCDPSYYGNDFLEKELAQEACQFIRRFSSAPENKTEREFKLTICMTTFNRENELEEALESLKNQTNSDFELIVINDGSTDESAKIFHSAMKDKYFKDKTSWKWIDQDNTYLGQARNNAAAKASGNCLLFLDDDNVPESYMVQSYKDYWQKYDYKVFVSAFEIFYEEHPQAKNFWYPFPTSTFAKTLGNIIADAQCLIDVDLFKKINGYTTDKGIGYEDWEFYLKILETESIFPIQKPLYRYRVHKADNSMRKNTKAYLNNKRAIRPLQRMYPRLARSFMQNIAHFNSHNYITAKKS